MRYLMLMWAQADAASGDEADFQVWADFDAEARTAGVFVDNGALQPASREARIVRPAISGHAFAEAVERRPYADGPTQIEAFYLMECRDLDHALEWAHRLPTYGHVEVRELLSFEA